MKRRQVLIADDFPQTRDGLQALLSTYPEIQVVAQAADGREAVQLVGAVQPDVVLMDIHMPNMDGLDATQIIKTSWPDHRADDKRQLSDRGFRRRGGRLYCQRAIDKKVIGGYYDDEISLICSSGIGFAETYSTKV